MGLDEVRRTDAWINEVSAFVRRDSKKSQREFDFSPPIHPPLHSERTTLCQPGREVPPEADLADCRTVGR